MDRIRVHSITLHQILVALASVGVMLALVAGRLNAGEIRGRVVIKRRLHESSKIVSRSIIQRYVTKSKRYHEVAEGSAQEQPRVVVYLDGPQLGNHYTEGQKAILDQTHERFVPHVLPILVGTTIRFLNSDEVYHNVFSYSPAKSFDLGRYAKGKYRSVNFDRPGVVKIYCDIHTHMSAFILVLQNPYFTTTDEDGNFTIKDVPPGTYTIKAWYGRWPEKSGIVSVNSSARVRQW